MLLEIHAVQRLCQDINDHFLSGTENKPTFPSSYYIAHIILLYVDVLVVLVDRLILAGFDRALVICVYPNAGRLVVSTHVCDESAEPHGFFSCWAKGDAFRLTT